VARREAPELFSKRRVGFGWWDLPGALASLPPLTPGRSLSAFARQPSWWSHRGGPTTWNPRLDQARGTTPL